MWWRVVIGCSLLSLGMLAYRRISHKYFSNVSPRMSESSQIFNSRVVTFEIICLLCAVPDIITHGFHSAVLCPSFLGVLCDSCSMPPSQKHNGGEPIQHGARRSDPWCCLRCNPLTVCRSRWVGQSGQSSNSTHGEGGAQCNPPHASAV